MNNDESLSDIEIEEIFFNAELEARKDEPLSEELCVHIQPLTMERLRNYMRYQKRSLDSVVNDILMDFLYGMGE